MPPRGARFQTEPVLIGAIRAHRISDRQTHIVRVHHEPVRDGIRFCCAIMDETMAAWGMHLEPEEYEDAVSRLLILALRLEQRYDPALNPSFAGYARSILIKRAVDAGPRHILGRTGARLAERSHEELDESSLRNTRHGTAHPLEQSNGSDPRSTTGRGDQGNRNRRSAGCYALLGLRKNDDLEAGDDGARRDPPPTDTQRDLIAA